MKHEAEAARIVADLFSANVMRGLDEKPHPRTFLYSWERDALAWLREWRKRDKTTGINGWTQACLLGQVPAFERLTNKPRADVVGTQDSLTGRS